MKTLVIGATGTLGSAVAEALAASGHEVVRASRHGPVRADLTDPGSLDALFAQAGPLDAVMCCAASGGLAPLDSASDADFRAGLEGKLIGQVNLVRRALSRLRDGGSITLTSGRFDRPVPGSSPGFLVNSGLEAFVRAAALEMPRGLRLNVVSPGWLRETLTALDAGTAAALRVVRPADGTPAAEVARLYVAAVEGTAHGRTLTLPELSALTTRSTR
ncbi:short chain dehydrogenase [Streptomyces sp. CA-250714]|uniref:short chain dehydrogenase n=1 Tax=Streptomyces sp. CA-250714 TaxID=3240060 RepID=UPI003D8F2ADD